MRLLKAGDYISEHSVVMIDCCFDGLESLIPVDQVIIDILAVVGLLELEHLS